LARNTAKTTWQFDPVNYSKLQHVTTDVDRRRPKPEHLEGDLDRTVLLNAEIVSESNTFPCAVAVDISHLVPTALTHNQAATWIIEPDTKPTMMGQPINVFAPTDLLSKRMFARWERCDHETLAKEFKFEGERDTSGKALMRTDGVAMELLENNQANFDGIKVTPELKQSRYIELNEQVARAIYDHMKEEVDRISRGFVSMKSLSARWFRPDGHEW
jgi:hypothetical protein